MNDKTLIAKLDRAIKEIRERLRPLIKTLAELEETHDVYIPDIRPLNALGKPFKYRGIRITPGIIIDHDDVCFKTLAEYQNDKLHKDSYPCGQAELLTSYEPKYDLYKVFYNRQDTDTRELVLKRDTANDMILDISFQHKWINFKRAIKKNLNIERYMNAIPAEIERFKQDVKLAKLYVDEKIAGEKPFVKKNQLISMVEEEMSKMEAKGKEVCKLKGKEKEYCDAMDKFEKEGYLAHGGLYYPILLTPQIKDKDITINLHWDEDEKKIQLKHEFKPKGYKHPGKYYCPCCSGEDDFEEPFGIGMHLGKKNISYYRRIPFNPFLLPKELERFRRDLKLVKCYEGYYLRKHVPIDALMGRPPKNKTRKNP